MRLSSYLRTRISPVQVVYLFLPPWLEQLRSLTPAHSPARDPQADRALPCGPAVRAFAHLRSSEFRIAPRRPNRSAGWHVRLQLPQCGRAHHARTAAPHTAAAIRRRGGEIASESLSDTKVNIEGASLFRT